MAFAFVNIGQNSGDASAGTIASAATSATAGNALIVFVNNDDSRTITQVVDTAGNGFTQRGSSSLSTSRQYVFTAFPILGNASNVVTATFDANATFRRIFVMQYSFSGVCAFHDADSGTGSDPDGSNLVTSTANSAPTTDNEAVIASAVYTGGTITAATAGTNFNLRGTAEIDSRAEDRLVSTTGTYNASFADIDTTAGGAINWLQLHCILVEIASSLSVFAQGGGNRPAPFKPGIAR